MRFGKHPPKVDYRTLRLGNYLTAALPPPPPSVDTLGRIEAKLGAVNPPALFPMDGNDTLGDCTIAALAHAVTAFRGLLGHRHIMSTQAVIKLYRHLTGGPDTGLNELDVLNYWRAHSVSGDKIHAFVSINVKNHAHVQQAIQIFGGVYIGFQVQQDCINDFNAHRPWTPGPLLQEGHAVFAVGYDADTLNVLTWGNTQKGTWAWWDECVDEAYVVLPPEATTTGFLPSGFNVAGLQADLAAVAN